MRKVLVALDGIAVSEIAIEWVRMILPEARLVLGRVIEPAYVPMGDFGLAYVPYSTKRAEQDLQRLSERLVPSPTVVIQEGFPAGRLKEIASKSECDLIVVLGRGGSQARRRFVGGTVEQLLHETRIPLLVVPATRGPQRRKPRLRKIVVPLDGGETSERILPLIQPVARRHRATVVLVHCLKKGRSADPKPSMDRLRVLAARLRKEGVRATSVVSKGDVLLSLGKVVEAEGADLMAMSVYGHGALRHLLFGAQASRIIQKATVPVLVLRHDAPGVAE